jgi:uncharacterized damage-inducible protein DinB
MQREIGESKNRSNFGSRSTAAKPMTTTRQLLLTELDYTVWANLTLLDASATLTAEELSRNLGASHRSVLRTLRHIYDGERFWTNNLITNSIPSVAEMEAAGAADQAQPDPVFEVLRQAWPKVWADARQWLGSLSEEELSSEISCRDRDGTEFFLPRWKVFLHMVHHSTLHRGQIITMFRTLGKHPPSTELFTYYRMRPSDRG